MAQLEHINITVSDARKTAALLSDLFGWHIRWEGPVMNGRGYSVHVGSDESYLAVYAPEGQTEPADTATLRRPGALNHLGVVVSDLDQVEARVQAHGFTPHMHADYAPGRRFYFDGPDGLEIEVVSYA
ncbi:MAG: VOC family protein [Pseudomonadota bacterium]